MKKFLKILILIIVLLIFLAFAIRFLSIRGVISHPDARTVYRGSVEIEHISIEKIKEELMKHGCVDSEGMNVSELDCYFHYINSGELKDKVPTNSLAIYPRGWGWGPVFFSLSENKMWATKDIEGSPDKEKYKEEVREDIEYIGNIVTIKENTWEFEKIEHPVTYVY